MKNVTKISALAALVTFVAGGPVLAQSNHSHDDDQQEAQTAPSSGMQMPMHGEHGAMMQMMKKMHTQMMGGGAMHGKNPSNGQMMIPMMMQRAMPMHGGKGLLPAIQARASEFDKDKDGKLSIAEFEVLHSALIREKMVDRFQHIDADGDGMITEKELGTKEDVKE